MIKYNTNDTIQKNQLHLAKKKITKTFMYLYILNHVIKYFITNIIIWFFFLNH